MRHIDTFVTREGIAVNVYRGSDTSVVEGSTMTKQTETKKPTAKQNHIRSLKRQATMQANKAAAKNAPPKKGDAAKARKEGKAKAVKEAKPPRICRLHSTQPPISEKDISKNKHWNLKIADMGQCSNGGKPRTQRAKWCQHHNKLIRKEQLRVNNITWDKRVESGEAGHHKQYRNKPTEIVKKLKLAGLEPEKYIKQGGVGEKVGLPQTVVKKIEKVELPAKKKAPAEKKPTPKPTEVQKKAASSMRKAMKTAKAAPPVKVHPATKATETASKIAAPLTAADVKKVEKDLGKLVQDLTGTPAAVHVEPKVQTGVKLHPLEDGEIRASQAVTGKKYEVAGINCEALGSVTPPGAKEMKYSFKRLDDPKAAPMLLVPSSPIRPL